jgi:hypothetical protein
MSLTAGQPKIRYAGHFNPGDISGLSYVPKVITVEKALSGSAAETFMAMPAQAFLSKITAVITEVSASTDATIVIGLDGDTSEFVTGTDFTADTVGNFAIFNTGYFFTQADNMAFEVTGHTVTNGELKIIVEYYELAEMFQVGGVHVSL